MVSSFVTFRVVARCPFVISSMGPKSHRPYGVFFMDFVRPFAMLFRCSLRGLDAFKFEFGACS